MKCLFGMKVIKATITDRLRAGIKVGSREYRVLGGSNSLIRDHGYYLCARYKDTTAESIRKDIGKTTVCMLTVFEPLWSAIMVFTQIFMTMFKVLNH